MPSADESLKYREKLSTWIQDPVQRKKLDRQVHFQRKNSNPGKGKFSSKNGSGNSKKKGKVQKGKNKNKNNNSNNSTKKNSPKDKNAKSAATPYYCVLHRWNATHTSKKCKQLLEQESLEK